MNARWHRRSGSSSRHGTALVFAMVIAVALGALSLALLATNLGQEKVRVHDAGIQRSFFVAEAGLNDALVRMSAGLLDLDDGGPAFVGTPDAPLALGPSAYWVEITAVGTHSWSLASTGVHDEFEKRLELVVSREPTGFFQYAAFGAEGVLLDSNAFIDSFDSTRGSYESQVQSGQDYAGENGNVGSNGDIVLRSNTEVHGDVTPGPGGVLDDSAPRTYISGSTDSADEAFPMPPIVVPTIVSSGSLDSGSDLVLGPGLIRYDSLRMQGGTTLTIVGPATVVLDDYSMKSGAAMVLDATGGEIDVYGPGDFVLESNTDMTTLSDSAVDVTIYLSGDNMSPGRQDRIQLSSNAEFIGAIYAPNIDYRLESNFDVYGSIICGRLDLSSNGEIHFDEALLYDDDGESDGFDVSLWRVLPNP